MKGGLCASEKDTFSHKYDKKVYIYEKNAEYPCVFLYFLILYKHQITMGEKQDDADFVR